MSEENIQEVTGVITGITKSSAVHILSFQDKDQGGVLALTIATRRYHELFPAGDPTLGIEMVAVLKHENNQLTVVALYDPEGDFIAADDVPDMGTINYQLDDSQPSDVYAELLAARQTAVNQIDASKSDLELLAAEHDAENTADIPTIDYGNPVLGQGGLE